MSKPTRKAMNIVQEVDDFEFGKETNTSALKLLLNSPVPVKMKPLSP
ncbi:hypothetical protein OK016_17235 [Vibrio chagasii]|nr:hypothetical protein [Vibrio chagasii]